MEEIRAYLNQLASKINKFHLLGLVVLMGITNPSLEAHKNEVIFNMGRLSADGREYHRSMVSRRNFLLMSLTIKNFKDHGHKLTFDYRKVVGVGFLGQVYITTDYLK